MTLTQAIKISQAAKAAGYGTQAENGKIRFITVEYDGKGKSTITPRTDFMDFETAMKIIAS